MYYSNEYIMQLLSLFDAYNSRKDFFGVSFEKCKGVIRLIIGGHIHKDFITHTEGGIPIVLTDSDSIEKSCNRIYLPVRGLVSEQCVTFVGINRTTGAIKLIRAGRGRNVDI